MVNWIGLALPFIYLGLLVGSLATFSSLYRRRKLSKAASLEPWFPPHLTRNIYLSLLHIEPEEKGAVKVPDTVLKAALLRRATEDIHRIVQIRNQKPALANLLQRGSIGDDLWQRFLRAEKEIEEELRDVVSEANAFTPGWGQVIFQSANEMATNQLIRNRMAKIQGKGPAEKEWWEKHRSAVQAEFPPSKELDPQEASGAAPAAPASTVSRSSEEDAVLVESGGPAA